jgi:hypothetical protein
MYTEGAEAFSPASDDDGGGLHAPRIARRCPGRTSEQTRFSSASERGRQRLRRRDPRERSEQSDIARTPKKRSSGRQGFPGVEPGSQIGSVWGKLEVGGDPIKDR